MRRRGSAGRQASTAALTLRKRQEAQAVGLRRGGMVACDND